MMKNFVYIFIAAILLTGSMQAASVSIGNITGDNNFEVIAVTEKGELIVFDNKGIKLFKYTNSGEIIIGRPALVNSDNDDFMEIAVISRNISSGNFSIHYINGDGSPASLKNDIFTGGDLHGDPLVADLNNDNIVEIYYINNDEELCRSNDDGDIQYDPIALSYDDIVQFSICNNNGNEYVYIKFGNGTNQYYDSSLNLQTGIDIDNPESTFVNNMDVSSILGYDCSFDNKNNSVKSFYWGDIYRFGILIPNLNNDTNNITIFVDELADNQPIYTDIEITAEITNDLDRELYAELFFKRHDETNYQSVEMIYDSGISNFTGTIPADYVSNEIYYFVKAYDGFGNEKRSPLSTDESDYYSFTVSDSVAPVALELELDNGNEIEMGNFRVSGVLKIKENYSITSFTLYWTVNETQTYTNLNPDENRGIIEINLNLDLTDGGTITINESDTINFWIQGRDDATNSFKTNNNSSTAPLLSITVIEDMTKPEQPVDINTVLKINGDVLLTWKPAAGMQDIDDYYIYRKSGEETESIVSINDNGTYTIIEENGWEKIGINSGVLSFLDSNTVTGEIYSYFISCRDGAGNESDGSVAQSVIISEDDVNPPSGIRFLLLVDSSVKIDWDEPVQGGIAYNIYRKKSAEVSLTDYDVVYKRITSLSYIDNNVEPGETYYYVLTTLNQNYVESAPTDVFSITITSSQDIEISACIDSVDGDNVTIKWENNGSVAPVSYRVYRSITENININDNVFILPEASNISNNEFTFTDTSAYDGNNYCYIVGAVNANGLVQVSEKMSVDRKCPEIVLDNETEAIFNRGVLNEESSWSFIVNDAEMQGLVFEISLNEKQIFYKQNLSDNPFKINYDFTSGLYPDGFYNIIIKASDRSVNSSRLEFNVLIQNSAYSVSKNDSDEIISYSTGIYPDSYFKGWLDNGKRMVYRTVDRYNSRIFIKDFANNTISEISENKYQDISSIVNSRISYAYNELGNLQVAMRDIYGDDIKIESENTSGDSEDLIEYNFHINEDGTAGILKVENTNEALWYIENLNEISQIKTKLIESASGHVNFVRFLPDNYILYEIEEGHVNNFFTAKITNPLSITPNEIASSYSNKKIGTDCYPDSGKLIFTAVEGGHRKVFQCNIDGTGPSIFYDRRVKDVSGVHLSKDGSYAAYVIITTSFENYFDIAKTSDPTNILFHKEPDSKFISWLDDNTILFLNENENNSERGIYIWDFVNDSANKIIDTPDGRIYDLSISPDGKIAAYEIMVNDVMELRTVSLSPELDPGKIKAEIISAVKSENDVPIIGSISGNGLIGFNLSVKKKYGDLPWIVLKEDNTGETKFNEQLFNWDLTADDQVYDGGIYEIRLIAYDDNGNEAIDVIDIDVGDIILDEETVPVDSDPIISSTYSDGNTVYFSLSEDCYMRFEIKDEFGNTISTIYENYNSPTYSEGQNSYQWSSGTSNSGKYYVYLKAKDIDGEPNYSQMKMVEIKPAGYFNVICNTTNISPNNDGVLDYFEYIISVNRSHPLNIKIEQLGGNPGIVFEVTLSSPRLYPFENKYFWSGLDNSCEPEPDGLYKFTITDTINSNKFIKNIRLDNNQLIIEAPAENDRRIAYGENEDISSDTFRMIQYGGAAGDGMKVAYELVSPDNRGLIYRDVDTKLDENIYEETNEHVNFLSWAGNSNLFYSLFKEGALDIYKDSLGAIDLTKYFSDAVIGEVLVYPSPDLNRVVYQVIESNKYKIYYVSDLTNPDNNSQEILSSKNGNKKFNCWSGDSKYFSVNIAGGNNRDLYLLDTTDINNETQISNGTDLIESAGINSFHPDNDKLAYTVEDDGYIKTVLYDISAMQNDDLNNSLDNVNQNYLFAGWSPNGKWVAMQSLENGSDKIYIIDSTHSRSPYPDIIYTIEDSIFGAFIYDNYHVVVSRKQENSDLHDLVLINFLDGTETILSGLVSADEIFKEITMDDIGEDRRIFFKINHNNDTSELSYIDIHEQVEKQIIASITRPVEGEIITTNSVKVFGNAIIPDGDIQYTLKVTNLTEGKNDSSNIAAGTANVLDDVFTDWNLSERASGYYEIKLTVMDSSGNNKTDSVRVNCMVNLVIPVITDVNATNNVVTYNLSEPCTAILDIFDGSTLVKTVKIYDQKSGPNQISWDDGKVIGYRMAEYKKYNFMLHAIDSDGNGEADPGEGIIFPPGFLFVSQDLEKISPNNDGVKDFATINVKLNDYANLSFEVYSSNYNSMNDEQKQGNFVYGQSDFGLESIYASIVFNGKNPNYNDYLLPEGQYSIVCRDSIGNEGVAIVDLDLNNNGMIPETIPETPVVTANPGGELVSGINDSDNVFIDNYSKLIFNTFAGNTYHLAYEKIGSKKRSVHDALDSITNTLNGERFGQYGNNDANAYLGVNSFGALNIDEQVIGNLNSTSLLTNYEQVYINKNFSRIIASKILSSGRRVLYESTLTTGGSDISIDSLTVLNLSSTGFTTPDIDFLCFSPSGTNILFNVKDGSSKSLILYDLSEDHVIQNIANAYSGKEAISPGGNWIVYYRNDNVEILNISTSQSYVIDSIENIRLFEGFGYCDDIIVFTDMNNNIYLYRFSFNGSSISCRTIDLLDALKLSQGTNFFGSFSGNHRYIGFSKEMSGQKDLFVYDIKGNNLSRLTETGNNELFLGFSYDNTKVAYMEYDKYNTESLKVMDLQVDNSKYIIADITNSPGSAVSGTAPGTFLELDGIADADDFEKYQILYKKNGDNIYRIHSEYNTSVPDPAGQLCRFNTTDLNGDGDYEIVLKVIDRAGNFEEDKINVTINNYSDTNPPVIVSNVPADGETNSFQTIVFTVKEIKANDSGVDPNSIKLFINGFEYVSGDNCLIYYSADNGTNAKITFDASILNPNPLALYQDGTVSVSLVQLKDIAGNNISEPYNFSFIYKPVISGINAYQPDIVINDDEYIFRCWTDIAINGNKEIYFNNSVDGGNSFSTPVSISIIDTNDSYTPSIAVDDNNIVIAYRDDILGSEGIYLAYSSDNGGSFNRVYVTNTVNGYNPRIISDGTEYFIGYVDKSGSDSKLYLNSTSDFSSFNTSPLLIGDNSITEFDFANNGSELIFVYQRNKNIYIKKYNGSLSGEILIESDTGMISSPKIDINDGKGYILWDSKKDDDSEIYMAEYVSDDNIIQKRITESDITSTSNISRKPDININGDLMVVSWEDNRSGFFEIYIKISFNNGETFSEDTLLKENSGYSVNSSSVMLDNGSSAYSIYGVWEYKAEAANVNLDSALSAVPAIPLPTTSMAGINTKITNPGPGDPRNVYIDDNMTIAGEMYIIEHVNGLNEFPEDDPLVMTFYYDEAILLANSINEQDVRIYIFDETPEVTNWIPASDIYHTEYDYEKNSITVFMTHLSDFAPFYDPNGPGQIQFITPGGIVNSSPVNIDGIADAETTVYLFRNEEVISEGIASVAGTFHFSDVVLVQGENIFQALSKDSSEKYSIFSEELTIYFDNLEPGLVIKKDGNIVNGNEIIDNNSIELDFECFDNAQNGCSSGCASGCANTYYSIEETGDSASFKTSPIPVTVSEINKVYELQYYAEDNAGNNSSVKIKKIILENISPVADIRVQDGIEVDGNYYISPDSKVIISGYDTGSIVSGLGNKQYKILGVSPDWENYLNPLIFNMDGNVTLQARVFDRAGNVSGIIEKSFMMDNTPPSLSFSDIYTFDNRWIVSSVQQIEIFASDSGTGLDSIYFFINNKKYNYSEPFKFGEIDESMSFEHGDQFLCKIFADDKANNIINVIKQVEIDDKTPDISVYNLLEGNELKQNRMLHGKIYDLYLKEYYVYIGNANDETPIYKLISQGSANIINDDICLLDITGLQTGSYILKIEAADHCGNTAIDETRFSITDRIPPVTTLTPIPEFYQETVNNVILNYASLLYKYQLTAVDDYSGIDKKFYAVNNYNFIEYESPFILSHEGNQTVYYYSIDSAGNKEKINEISIIVDGTPPDIRNISLSSEPYIPLIGNLAIEFDLNEKSVISVSIVSGTNITIINDSIFYEPGIVHMEWDGILNGSIAPAGFYNYEITAVDMVGNDITYNGSFEIIWDVQPPRTTISVGDPKYGSGPMFVRPDTVFSLSAVDDLVTIGDGLGLGVAETKYGIDVDADTVYVSFTVPGEGLHTINYLSIDTIGNIEVQRSLEIAVDDTPPVTSFDLSGEVFYANGIFYANNDINITLIAVDGGLVHAGIQYTRFRINGNAWNDGASIVIGSNNEGTYLVEYYSVDNVDNQEEIRNITFVIDTTSPAITVNGVEDGEYYNKTVAADISITDANINTSTITINGLEYTSGTLIEIDGEYTLEIYAEDLAGNSSSEQLDFVIDKVAPVIQITGIENNGMYNYDVTPVITVTEPYLKTEWIKLNGENIESGTIISNDGEYVLDTYAEDMAGNFTSEQISFIIDKTDPVITITGVEDGGAYNYDVTPVVLIEDIYLKTNWIKLNGDEFESGTVLCDDGEYNLEVYAEDLAGNISMVQAGFVIDQTAPDIPENLIAFSEGKNALLYWDDVTNSDLAGYNVYRDGVKINPGLVNISVYTDIEVSFGLHEYTVTSVDWVNNESAQSIPYSITIDESIIITWPESGIYYRDKIKIIGDMALKDKKSEVFIEYGEGTNPDNWTTIKSFKNWPASKNKLVCMWHLREKEGHEFVPLNGEYRLRVRVVNNVTAIEDTVVVWIDNEEPQTTVENITATGIKDEYELEGNELIITAIDPEVNGISSGIRETRYAIDEVYDRDISTWPIWDGTPVELSVGEHMIGYFSEDNAQRGIKIDDEKDGNKEKKEKIKIIVTQIAAANINENEIKDITSPIITITGVDDGKSYNRTVEPNVEVMDENLETVTKILDGRPFENGQRVDAEGMHNLVVDAEDESGNTANETVNFDIDRKAPLIVVEGIENDGVYDSAEPVVNVVDNNLSNVEIKINENVIKNENVETDEYNYKIDKITDEGDYTLKVDAFDRASNTASEEIDFKIREKDLDKYLLFYTSFDQSSNAGYAIGCSNVIEGGIITRDQSGYKGNALSEKGIGVQYSSVSNIDVRKGTVMMRIKPEWDTKSYMGGCIFSLKKDNSNSQDNYIIDILLTKNKKTIIKMQDKNESETNFSVSNAAPESKWYNNRNWTHLALTWDNKKAIIYINGKNLGEINLNNWIPPESTTFWIGNRHKDNSRNIEAKIDEFRIYNRVLTEQEIKENINTP